jgi:AcrR family transcriptional regulator
LAAARQLLVEEGWEAITHQRVAERAQLGRATIWRHWPETSDLLRDAIAGEILVIVSPTTDDLRADLLEVLDRVRRELVDEGFGRVLAALIDRAEWDDDMRKIKMNVVGEGTRVIRDRIRLAVRNNKIGRDADNSHALSQLVGPMVYRRLVSGETITRPLITRLVDDFIALHPASPRTSNLQSNAASTQTALT